MRRFLSCLPSVLLLAMNAHAGTVDGTINPGYGNNLGRAVVAASPGFGAANPGLRAMATSASGRTWLFGEDRSGLQNELLLIARLDAATGQTDAGFGGGDGLVTVGFPAGFHGPKIDGALIQPDGKPLIFGYAFRLLGEDYETVGIVCRLNVAGNFDLGFGNSGCRMLTGLASHEESCTVRDLAIDSDNNGMIVVGECRGEQAGATNPVFVAKLTASGGFDPEFTGGGVGFPTVSGGKIEFINALKIQQGGRFVAAATLSGTDGDYDIGVLQFSNDGTLDPTWHSAGARRVPIDIAGNQHDFGMGIVQRADGRILVAGLADGPDYDDAVVLVQLEADGDLDASFGTGGIATGPEPLTFSVQFADDVVPLQVLHSLAIDDLGRPVVLGLLGLAGDLRVYRFTAQGAKDKRFGLAERGLVDIDHTAVLEGPFDAEDWPKGMVVERDRIVVASRSDRTLDKFAFVVTTLQAVDLLTDGFE
jgi:uncharacterized delta-60 repeat protein